MAGFVEGVQYRKQKAVAQGTGIPDFTFLLPQDSILYMDVKFPLDNYVRYVNAESELDQARSRDDFLRDVRVKVKDSRHAGTRAAPRRVSTACCSSSRTSSSTRSYRSARGHAPRRRPPRTGSSCARRTRCSAVSARIIASGGRGFRTERTASEILEVLGSFRKQWARSAPRWTRWAVASPPPRAPRVRRARRGPDPSARATARPHRGPAAPSHARRDRCRRRRPRRARTPGLRWLSARPPRPGDDGRHRDLRVRPGRAVDRLRLGGDGADRGTRCSASGS